MLRAFQVGTVGTHKHDGTTSCYFNAAFRVGKGPVRMFLSHFRPQKWTSFTEGGDARIDWTADATHAAARLDGGKAAEVAMSRFSGATGEGTAVIKNMRYFAAHRNDGFNIMPVDRLAYRRGPRPAPFEFRGTSGWTIRIYMDSNDVVAA